MDIDLNWNERDCIIFAIQQLDKEHKEEHKILKKVIKKIIPTIKVID